MDFIDEATAQRTGLSWVLQELAPHSPYGKLLKSRIKAVGPGAESWLRAEWAAIAALGAENPDQLQKLDLCLREFRDILGALRRAVQGYALEEVDLFALKRFLDLCLQLEEIRQQIQALPEKLRIPAAPALVAALAPGGAGEGFYLADNFSPALAKGRQEQRRLKAELSRHRQRLQDSITRETGKSFNSFGRLRLHKLDPANQILAARADILVAAEEYVETEYILREDERARALSAAIRDWEERTQKEEFAVRLRLSQVVKEDCRPLLAACRRVGRIDLLLAKSRLALALGGCVPELVTAPMLELTEFRHPQVSRRLENEGLSFQPLSFCLKKGVTVITGANMGGKSVSLCSAGLAIAMAQFGLLVPAKACRFSPRAFIYYSQQAEDSSLGLSSFGAEIHELAKKLPFHHKPGLYLLDEPARGTNPREGAALVKAIASWLSAGKSAVLVATHYPGLSTLAGTAHLQVAGLSLEGKEIGAQDVKSLQRLMDYSLLPGQGEVPGDALKVAAFLGLAPEIIALAAKELAGAPREVL